MNEQLSFIEFPKEEITNSAYSKAVVMTNTMRNPKTDEFYTPYSACVITFNQIFTATASNNMGMH